MTLFMALQGTCAMAADLFNASLITHGSKAKLFFTTVSAGSNCCGIIIHEMYNQKIQSGCDYLVH